MKDWINFRYSIPQYKGDLKEKGDYCKYKIHNFFFDIHSVSTELLVRSIEFND